MRGAPWSSSLILSGLRVRPLRGLGCAARDPVGREDRVVTVKVGPTGDLGLFGHFAYLDLTASAETDAERLLLERAQGTARSDLPRQARDPPRLPRCPDAPRGEKAPLPRPDPQPAAAQPGFRRAGAGAGEVLTLLVADEPVVLTQAITGLGGIGKTQTALAYAHRHLDDRRLVWWLKAEQSATLAADYAGMAEPLGLPEMADQPKQVEAVRRALEDMEGWLLVFDNVGDPAAVQRDYFPRRGDGRVLLTSRRTDWYGIAKALPLDVLPEAVPLRWLTVDERRPAAFRSDREAEDLVDEGPLRRHVVGGHGTHLSLGQHRHRLDAGQRPPRVPKL